MSNTPAIRRRAYFISDRTGITVESMGEALLNQFNAAEFKQRTYPFIDTPDKAHELLAHIAEEVAEDGNGWGRPLIFSSVVNNEVRKIIHTCPAYHIDFYDSFITNLEKELHTDARRITG
ncbi:MAG: kinase/pyrophosphorylase, partial [Neisseriaceae bacterium]|nr:kinase/pyrophosphorylase [Neisseriaceae bacterium]